MADTDVGKKGTFHLESGDVPGKIVKYKAGRPEGDHLVEHAVGGTGDGYDGTVTRTWTVIGTETGAFSIKA